MNMEVKKKKERRHHHGKDGVMKLIDCISLFSLFSLFSSYTFMYIAKPDYYWDRKQQTANPNMWNEELMDWFLYSTYIAIALAIIGMLINIIRARRRSDSYRLSLILAILFSTFNIIFFFIYS